MLSPMWLFWLLISIFAGVLLLLVFWCRRQFVLLQNELKIVRLQLESCQQISGAVQAETEELRAGIIGVGQSVLSMQEQHQLLTEQMVQLQEQQHAISLSDPESKIYSRAMKMVELGADLEEIIRECELPRAEAELLFNLHQQKKR